MEDLKALRSFRAVSRCGSFTEAARQQGLTTAAISKAIGRLESDLETRLFKRSTRQLSLTNEGRIFLEKVDVALAALEEGADKLHELRSQPEGNMLIATSTAFGKEYLLPRLTEFLDSYPRVSLEIKFDDSRIDLIREGYDLSIQVRDPSEQTYITRELCELPLVMVASPDYLARRGVPVTMEDLAGHDCITLRQPSGQLASWEFQWRERGKNGYSGARRTKHFEPAGRLVVAGQYDAVLDSAVAGHGITVTYGHSALSALKSGELKILLPDYRIIGGGVESTQIYLCYPHKEYLPYNVRTLVDYLVDRFRTFPDLKFDSRWIAK